MTARNSGGSAAQSFQVTVEEAIEIPDPPAALTADAWDVYWDVDPTQDGVRATWHFAVKERSGPRGDPAVLARARERGRRDAGLRGSMPASRTRRGRTTGSRVPGSAR